MENSNQEESVSVFPENIKMIKRLARVMRRVRETRGFSKDTIARELGVTLQELSQMEKAQQEPTAVQWWYFCVLTEIPADAYCYTGRGFERWLMVMKNVKL